MCGELLCAIPKSKRTCEKEMRGYANWQLIWWVDQWKFSNFMYALRAARRFWVWKDSGWLCCNVFTVYLFLIANCPTAKIFRYIWIKNGLLYFVSHIQSYRCWQGYSLVFVLLASRIASVLRHSNESLTFFVDRISTKTYMARYLFLNKF